MIVDRSQQAVTVTVLNTFTSSIHSVINKRLDNINPGSNRYWTDYFNTYRKRDEEKKVFAYDQRTVGFVGGIEHVFKNARVGLMGGYSTTDVEANTRSFKTETDSYIAGLYGSFNHEHFDLQVSFIAGREDHESTRVIRDALVGTERAMSDFYSTFISPSVKVSTSIPLTKRLTLRPSADVVYSRAWYDDYREKGSSYSNLSMDDRTLDAFNWTGKLNLRYKIASWCNVDIYGSGNGRYTDDEGIRATLAGQTKMIENKADTSVRSANFGGSINLDIHDQIMANFSYEHSEVSGGETKNNITFGINFNF
jgi:outer membrane autotransporter protein